MSSKKAIFQEVGAKSPEAHLSVIGSIDAGQNVGLRGPVRLWLIVLFGLVTCMIAVGGLTRLTDSGLSITEWRPITGAIPPMSLAAWDAEFAKYKQIPEYQLQNLGMSLNEFKVIYWWEWGHRQLGRVIGLVWALGFFAFILRKAIPAGWTGRLLFVGMLGGIQGAIGWWMVASGLSGEMLDVASYRLAAHLGIAFLILGFLTWFILLLGRTEKDLLLQRRARDERLFSISTGLLHLAFLQILFGALVAGIDAGRNYTDWPLMAGGFFPPEPFSTTPLWRNFFEDDGLVQFMHRIAGYLLLVFGFLVWRKSKSSGNDELKFAFNAMMVVMLFQVILGVMTVLNAAPWNLAILHQLGAVLLWVLILRARFLSGYPPQQLVKRV